MLGRASLTPGRVVALAGLVVAVGGLYQHVPGAGMLWDSLGPGGRSGVILGAALLVAAAFRPERGRSLDLAGAGLEHVVAWGAVAVAATHLGSIPIGLGAFAILAGASWDLVAAWGGEAARSVAAEPAGGAVRHGAVAAGVAERAR